MEIATFGMGCFWEAEASFAHVDGVKATRVGYAGGAVPDPTYGEVCRGVTGHTEVVEVTFNPQVISYEALLQIFFDSHDPTQPVTRQYSSIIFYHSPAQHDAALAATTQRDSAGVFSRAILTAIRPGSVFYVAEGYHQHYADKQHREKR